MAGTVAGDTLQSLEMKRHGEIRTSRRGGLGRIAATLAMKKYLILAIVCMAISFFAFMTLVSQADLSFAVPATAASFVFDTILARCSCGSASTPSAGWARLWSRAAWRCLPYDAGDCDPGSRLERSPRAYQVFAIVACLRFRKSQKPIVSRDRQASGFDPQAGSRPRSGISRGHRIALAAARRI